MNEKDKNTAPAQTKESDDARFWAESKYEREQVESDR